MIKNSDCVNKIVHFCYLLVSQPGGDRDARKEQRIILAYSLYC